MYIFRLYITCSMRLSGGISPVSAAPPPSLLGNSQVNTNQTYFWELADSFCFVGERGDGRTELSGIYHALTVFNGIGRVLGVQYLQ